MRRFRFSIAGLMVAIAMTALVIAGLRSANSATVAGAVLMLVCGVLGLAIVGVVSRRSYEAHMVARLQPLRMRLPGARILD